MTLTGIPANTLPLSAVACDGEVVLRTVGPRPVDVAFTPAAILASLDDLRAAAEEAIRQGG